MIGEIDRNTSVSAYNPPDDVKKFTEAVQEDYHTGLEILNKPYFELNDRSIIDDENNGQMMFNAFVDTNVDDPNDSWRWRGTRSAARNKGIAMHAHLTAGYLFPLFSAQNDDDEEDRDFSEMMRYVIEWMAAPNNSDYQSSFLQIVFGMITNPVTYLGAEYCEVMQKVKERQADGTITTKEMVDEILSGFQSPIYSASEILLTNAYERNIQKQRRIIKRRYVEITELEAKYGDHENWTHVRAGMKSVYNTEDGLFYDVKDEDHPTLVAEDTVLTRRDDSEVCFVGGVYMGEANIEGNMIRHRDNRGAPKYNIVPFGYHRIGEHFFFYKSLMNSLGWDNELYDAMSEIIMNQAMLEIDAPIAISGTDEVDSEIIFPKSVVTLENQDAKITRLMPPTNLNAGFGALRELEKSMSDSSLNPTMAGELPEKDQKAYSVAQAQANAKKILGAVGKSLGESVCKYGDLMKDIALNHIMSPQVSEDILSGDLGMKYRTLTLADKSEKGRSISKVIKFEPSYLGKEVTDDERREMEMEHLEEIGYPDNKNSFIKVNPEMAARFKYLTRVDPEEMFVKGQEYWQPILLNLKTALSQDPYIDQEALTRELMFAHFKSRATDFIKKPSALALPGAKDAGTDKYGSAVNSRLLSTASAEVAR